jgi:hypothetical protein
MSISGVIAASALTPLPDLPTTPLTPGHCTRNWPSLLVGKAGAKTGTQTMY